MLTGTFLCTISVHTLHHGKILDCGLPQSRLCSVDHLIKKRDAALANVKRLEAMLEELNKRLKESEAEMAGLYVYSYVSVYVSRAWVCS